MNHKHAGDFWCIVEDRKYLTWKRRGPRKLREPLKAESQDYEFNDDSEKPVGEWNAMTIECEK